MSYTNPHGFPQGRAINTTNLLRQILIAEIIAINGYQEHISNSNMEEINALWQDIMEDEKKHYGWILALLRNYDPEQAKQAEAAKSLMEGYKAPMQAYRADYERQIVLNNIREDIKGELEAVILYEEELLNLRYNDIRTTLQNIINEEKEHSEELTAILLKYDPDKYNGL